MIKKLQIILLPVLIIISSGCVDQSLNQYDVKSIELLEFVASKSTFCHCILEPPKESIIIIKNLEMPMQDTILMKKAMMKRLKINQLSTLDSMINLSKRFNLSEALGDSPHTIITRSVLDTITTSKAHKKWTDSIYKKCPEGLCHASKPIFSPDYKLVEFDIDFGGGCFPKQPKVYEYIDGGWTCEDCD